MTEKESEKLTDNDISGFSKKPISKTSNANRYIRLRVNKNNYGKPIEDEWYRREEGGVLVRASIVSSKESVDLEELAPAYNKDGTPKVNF